MCHSKNKHFLKKLKVYFSVLLIQMLLLTCILTGCASTSSNNANSLTANSASATSKPLKQDSSIIAGSLQNGLTYFVQQNKEPQNRITLRLVVKAGSNMEEDDQKGVAHFVEHLAFNGTEHFERNALVDYFESIGMNFGADVNAYTSFDETVFMLEVPADDPEMLANGMLVLHDWACALTFDQTELDKERGVVIEEWRLGQGVGGRVQNKLITPVQLTCQLIKQP